MVANVKLLNVLDAIQRIHIQLSTPTERNAERVERELERLQKDLSEDQEWFGRKAFKMIEGTNVSNRKDLVLLMGILIDLVSYESEYSKEWTDDLNARVEKALESKQETN